MPSYQAPVEDMQFVLHDLWSLEASLTNIAAFEDYTRDVVDATLQEAAKINQTLLAPLNASGDAQGCRFEQGVVTTPTGFKEAYQTFQAAGWCGVALSPEWGGQGCPEMLNTLLLEMLCASNVSFSLYPGLTQGVCQAINTHGERWIRERYLPKMVSGQWAGVMCLTEAQAGSDLGLLRTKAELQTDGSYTIH